MELEIRAHLSLLSMFSRSSYSPIVHPRRWFVIERQLRQSMLLPLMMMMTNGMMIWFEHLDLWIFVCFAESRERDVVA
jgi:hypothetical protein